VARMEEMKVAYRVLAGKREGKGPLGRAIRTWDLRTKGLQLCTPVAGCCEYGDEPSGSIKGEEFTDYTTID